MPRFDDLKIPIFPGVNDLPSPPSATDAPNGSYVTQKFNGLIDRLGQPIITEDSLTIYVNSDSGSDGNNGKLREAAKQTINGAIEEIAKTQFIGQVTIQCGGTFNETIDLRPLIAIKRGMWLNNSLPQLLFEADYESSNGFTINSNENLLLFSLLNPLRITFYNCNFNCINNYPINILQGNGILEFNSCTFKTLISNYNGALHLERCDLVKVEFCIFNNEDINVSWVAISTNNRTNLVVDGNTFNDFDYVISTNYCSKTYNFDIQNTFNNCNVYWEIYEGSKAFVRFLNTVSKEKIAANYFGEINQIDNIFINYAGLPIGTTIITENSIRTMRILSVRLNKLLDTGVALSLTKNGVVIGTSMTGEVKSLSYSISDDADFLANNADNLAINISGAEQVSNLGVEIEVMYVGSTYN